MNANFKVIGLTGLRIKLKSTATEADALTTRPSELFRFSIEQLLKTKWSWLRPRINLLPEAYLGGGIGPWPPSFDSAF